MERRLAATHAPSARFAVCSREMDGRLHHQVFRAARNYHRALARYAAALRSGEVERAAQDVIGASLHYRAALDALIQQADSPYSRRRLDCLRRLLGSASRQYNLRKKFQASSRSSSSRTLS